MHKLQKILLKRLSLQNNQRYGALTTGYDYDDNIVFHLKQLIGNNLIEKKDGIYTITLEGIQTIAHFEPMDLDDKGVKTFFIGFLCKDNNDNYLIKGHPNAQANFFNLPSGKPFFGENIDEAIVRTFNYNTGLTLSEDRFNFLGLHLKTIKTSDGEILFDDAFTIYEVNISAEEKKQMKLLNGVEWYSKKEIEDLENKWPEIDLCIFEDSKLPYFAYTHISNYIL